MGKYLTKHGGKVSGFYNRTVSKAKEAAEYCNTISDSLSSDIFSNAERTGALVCSVHPIYAFSNKFTAYQNLTKVRGSTYRFY